MTAPPVTGAPAPGDLDGLGLPRGGAQAPVPVGPPVTVGLVVEVVAAPDPEVHHYRLEASGGSSVLRPVAGPADLDGAPTLRVRAGPGALRSWLHGGRLLGHLLTGGEAEVDGDLMALSFVDGWCWFRRAVAARREPPTELA